MNVEIFTRHSMPYQVKITEFEGPLDLLLHLIKQSNIDIYDIKIDEITKQYLDYIKAMENLDLNIASEYLVMATELIEMKSRMLLPTKEVEEDEEDPKEALINRLLEYRNYKETVSEFRKLEELRKNYFTKIPSDLKQCGIEEQPLINEDIKITDLLEAFSKFLERKKLEEPIPTKITKKEYLVSERIREIRRVLKDKKKVEFTELFDVYSKDYIIVTFLSILDLARKEEIVINQVNNFDKIFLELRGE